MKTTKSAKYMQDCSEINEMPWEYGLWGMGYGLRVTGDR